MTSWSTAALQSAQQSEPMTVFDPYSPDNADIPPPYEVFGPGSPGYEAPVQGYGDRLALALQGLPPAPNVTRPGDTGPSGLLSFLTGAAQGFSGNRIQQMSERQKLNAALAQKAHDENMANLAAAKTAATESTKARTITPELAAQNNLTLETVGKSIDTLTPEQRGMVAKPKEKTGDTISMSDAQNSGDVLNMGDVGKPWNDPGIQKRVMGKPAERPPTAAMAFLKETDPHALAAAARRGDIDPGMLNLSSRGAGAAVMTILSKPGPNGEPPWNQAKAKLQWNAMQALTRNANSPQILSLQRAAASVQSATALMENLNKQLTDAVKKAPIPRSEIPESNKISLAAALRGVYGPEALKVARSFDTQIRVIRNEYPVVLSGGYAPQAPQIADAEQMMSPWYGEGGTQAALDILKQDAAYKIAAINGIGANTPGLMGENQYAGQSGGLPFIAPPPAAPIPSGGRLIRDPVTHKLVRAQ